MHDSVTEHKLNVLGEGFENGKTMPFVLLNVHVKSSTLTLIIIYT